MAVCADVQRHSVRKVQMVVAASHWSHQLMSLVSQYTPHATAVFTCAIEAFIKAEGELVSICHFFLNCWNSAGEHSTVTDDRVVPVHKTPTIYYPTVCIGFCVLYGTGVWL